MLGVFSNQAPTTMAKRPPHFTCVSYNRIGGAVIAILGVFSYQAPVTIAERPPHFTCPSHNRIGGAIMACINTTTMHVSS